MRLTRLKVSELRQFRQPFELADLQPGLNLIAGANEAGKSTLVRAIRAAFFERHRSTAVDDLRPWGDSAATPTIELDFTIGDESWHLRKAFLGRKRCELQAGSRRLEGAEAEDFLAELLGFRFADRGASRAEHGGIPGLLWIEQGAAQDVHEAVRHAADLLQRALDAQLGAVAASGGDELLQRVRELRGELLTATGKPRAALTDAIAAAERARAEAEALDATARDYRGQVDLLRALRAEHQADEQAAPWAELRRQLAQAEAALRDAEALGAERTTQAAAVQRADDLARLLRQQLAAAGQQAAELARRAATRERTRQALEPAQAAETAATRALTEAKAQAQAAAATLALARREETRDQLRRQADAARGRAADSGSLLQRARAQAERAAALRREAQALALPAAELKALRQQHERLRELDIQLSTLATRVGFELQPGAAVTLGGDALAGRGECLLSAPATLAIDGVGRFTIAPGGSDLAERAAERDRVQAEHQALLQRLGLGSRAEADAREQAHRARAADADAAAKALAVLAPQGLDTLQADVDRTEALRREAEAALAQLPPAPPEPPPSVAAAQAGAEAAQQAAEAAAAALERARHALATARSEAEAAEREHATLAALLDGEAHRAQQAEAQRRLVDAQAEAQVLQQRLQDLDARIAAARPDILAQDVQRLRRSAEEAERSHQQRGLRIAELQARLASTGAQGVDEALAQARLQQAAAERRRDQLQRRADALDLLLQTLETHRQALTRRLQAPLQRHLDHYLALLFPGGRLAVDEQLQPGSLQRPGPAGDEYGEFGALSFGAREQLGVISRLAYADLLREAGRPTLIILDDALVHSDAERLARMKRALYDAAQRHQVLLFTCHPDRWRDMGVAVRGLR
jgi:DNA repair exonuclease SbcCD ATPase subunit